MVDGDAVRDWAWWSSPEWSEYCEAYGSGPGRPVHETSWVLDLSQPLRLSHGHKARIRSQAGYMDPVSVPEYHKAHTTSAGRETRSQRTWDLMAEWVETGQAWSLRSRDAWRYVILDPPGAYDASAAGWDSHFLVYNIATQLQSRGFQWFELGPGATPGISTFKVGFGAVPVEP